MDNYDFSLMIGQIIPNVDGLYSKVSWINMLMFLPFLWMKSVKQIGLYRAFLWKYFAWNKKKRILLIVGWLRLYLYNLQYSNSENCLAIFINVYDKNTKTILNLLFLTNSAVTFFGIFSLIDFFASKYIIYSDFSSF